MLSFNFTPFPILTTERLVLQQITQNDVNEIFFLRSDPQVMKYIDRKPCRSVDEAAAFIDMLTGILTNNEGISWGITLKGNTTLIGNIALWRLEKENQRGEIGYALHPEYQGKSIMHEALAAVLDYAFNTMHLHSIEANTNPENKASQQVLMRHGFVQEAYFRENHYYDGQFLDSAIFSKIATTPNP